MISLWQSAYVGYLVAVGVGLLIGVERERNKGKGPQRGAAGVRTFAIAALLGAVAGHSASPLLIAIAGSAVILLSVVSYALSRGTDPGVTTEFALCLTYFLGVLAIREPQLAGMLGVLLALLLVSRSWLHEFVLHKLTARETLDAILLAASALIVLPVLPNHAVDRYGVVNPQLIWRLTVIVMLLNAFGYVASRSFGAKRGLMLAGFFGGFISSAATIAAMGHRARANTALRHPAIAGAALSSLSTVLELAIILAVAYPPLLVRMAPGLSCMGIAAGLYGALFAHRALRQPPGHEAAAGRAFQPRQAILFALMITIVLWFAAWLAEHFGPWGAIAGIAAGGFADAHSASATAAAIASQGNIDLSAAVFAIAAAVTTNTMTKIAVAFFAGGLDYVRRLAPGLVLMLLGLYGGVWIAAKIAIQ
jgi:uncharacterized membrane protein (DUF4010 family)